MSCTSIIIPTTGKRLGSLDRLIESIDAQQFLPLEILICGNQPNDALETRFHYWKKKFVRIQDALRLFFTGTHGANAARNLGIRESRGEVLLFLDDDTGLVDKSFVFEHEQMHRFRPMEAAIGGSYTLPEQAGLLQTADHWNALYWLQTTNSDLGYPYQELLGGNLSLKKSLIKDARFLESIRFGGTETEFIYRLQNSGQSVHWEPSLTVLHNNRLSPWDFANKAFLQGFGFGWRILSGLQPKPPGNPAPLRGINRLLRENEKPLRHRIPLLAAIFFFEVIFQAGIEHAYSHSKDSPSLPFFQNYLKKEGLRISGFNGLRNGIRRLHATADALSILKDSSKSLR